MTKQYVGKQFTAENAARVQEVDARGLQKYVQCLECGATFTNLRRTHFTSFKCTGRFKTIEEYLAYFPEADVMSQMGRANNAITKEGMIRKHGEQLGLEKWNAYREKQAKSNQWEAYEAKGFTREEFDSYNLSRAVTLDNQIKKHGEEEGRRRFEEYCVTQSKSGVSLEYFIEKYGEVEGLAKYKEVNAQKGITYENMVRKHGEILGPEAYHKWLVADRYSSDMANEFIELVVDGLLKVFETPIIHSAKFGGEYCIYDNRPYLYDFVITAPVQAMVEFHGDFWHANPSKYKADDIIKLRGGKFKTAQELWDRDTIKMQVFEQQRGYPHRVIWESDFLNNKQQTVNEVVEWILSLQK